MLRKYTTLLVQSARYAKEGEPLLRTAHRAEFNYDPRPGFLYVRSRAISSRTNDNFDTFPAEEIKKSWRSFIGKPTFVNHHNEKHRRARGVIIDAALHEDVNPDGSPDIWVECLHEVDAINFPKLAEAIVKGEIERTSMGCDVEFSECSACGNRASTPSQYCQHIPRLKGKRLRRSAGNGHGTEDVLISEICYGLHFFENSLLVEEPADPTAFFLGVDTRGLEMVSSLQKSATGYVHVVRHHDGPWDKQSWAEHVYHKDNCAVLKRLTKSKATPVKPGDKIEVINGHGCKRCGTTPKDVHNKANPERKMSSFGGRGINVLRSVRATTQTPNDGQNWAHLIQGDLQSQHEGGVYWPGERREARHLSGELEEQVAPIMSFGGRRITTLAYPRHCPECDHVMMKHGPEGCNVCNKKEEGGPCEGDSAWALHGKAKLAWGETKPCQKCGKPFKRSRSDATVNCPSCRASGNKRSPEPKRQLGPVCPYCKKTPSEYDISEKPSAHMKRHQGSKLAKHATDPHLETSEMELDAIGPDGKCAYCNGGRQNHNPNCVVERNANAVAESRYSSRKLAYGETVAPPQVDTLREENCPVCGSNEAFNGDECLVCGYVKPPDMYMDPDLEKAKSIDLRQDQNPGADVLTEEGLPTSGPTLECDNCGEQVVGDPEMAVAPGGTAPTSEPTGAAPGAPAPAPGEVQPVGTPSAPKPPGENPAQTPTGPAPDPNKPAGTGTSDTTPPPDPTGEIPPPPKEDEDKKPDEPPAGKDLPKSKDNDEDKDKSQEIPKSGDPKDPKELEKNNPVDSGDGAASDSSKHDDGKGDPQGAVPEEHYSEGDTCPTCGQGTLTKKDAEAVDQGDLANADPDAAKDPDDPNAPKDDKSTNDDKSDKSTDDDKDKDDKDKPPWLKDDKSKQGMRTRSPEGVNSMAARPVIAAVQEQQRELDRMKAQQEWLYKAVSKLAVAAGLRVSADAANPAEPVPAPGSEAPYTTLDQERQPDARGDVSGIGAVPGATDVAADSTTTVDQIGGINADHEYNISEDVTKPVAGTETERPLDEVRTIPEIQFGNPLKPDAAFPLTDAWSGQASLGTQARTYASLRLARLRLQAGMVDGTKDELIVAQAIDTNAGLPDAAIANEIETLSQVLKAQATHKTASAPREGARRLVPRQAQVERTVPSLGQAAPPSIAATASFDSDMAWDE